MLGEGEGVAGVRWWWARRMRTGDRPVGVYSRAGGPELRASGELGAAWSGCVTRAACLAGGAARWAAGDGGGGVGLVVCGRPRGAVRWIGRGSVRAPWRGWALEYGPAFQGLRGVWRDGEDVFAEVVLAEGQRGEAGWVWGSPGVARCCVACVGRGWTGRGRRGRSGEGSGGHEGGARLPFAWGGVVLGATGAAVLRVRLTRAGSSGCRRGPRDEGGALVVSVGSLVLREAPERVGAGGGGGIRCLVWSGCRSRRMRARVGLRVWAVVGGRCWVMVLGGGGVGELG